MNMSILNILYTVNAHLFLGMIVNVFEYCVFWVVLTSLHLSIEFAAFTKNLESHFGNAASI